jgi:hypothetical protein
MRVASSDRLLGIEVVRDEVIGLVHQDDRLIAVLLESGAEIPCDAAQIATRLQPAPDAFCHKSSYFVDGRPPLPWDYFRLAVNHPVSVVQDLGSLLSRCFRCRGPLADGRKCCLRRNFFSSSVDVMNVGSTLANHVVCAGFHRRAYSASRRRQHRNGSRRGRDYSDRSSSEGAGRGSGSAVTPFSHGQPETKFGLDKR